MVRKLGENCRSLMLKLMALIIGCSKKEHFSLLFAFFSFAFKARCYFGRNSFSWIQVLTYNLVSSKHSERHKTQNEMDCGNSALVRICQLLQSAWPYWKRNYGTFFAKIKHENMIKCQMYNWLEVILRKITLNRSNQS